MIDNNVADGSELGRISSANQVVHDIRMPDALLD